MQSQRLELDYINDRVPYVVDDNGDDLIRCVCDTCHEVFYATDEVIIELHDRFHTLECSVCLNKAFIATQDQTDEEW